MFHLTSTNYLGSEFRTLYGNMLLRKTRPFLDFPRSLFKTSLEMQMLEQGQRNEYRSKTLTFFLLWIYCKDEIIRDLKIFYSIAISEFLTKLA